MLKTIKFYWFVVMDQKKNHETARSLIINSSFIITRPHRDFFVNNTAFQVIICYWSCYFSDFLEEESSEFISSTFERKHFEETFTHTSLYLNITNVLLMFLPFSVQFLICRQLSENLSAKYFHYRHSYTHAHRKTFVMTDTGLCLPANM